MHANFPLRIYDDGFIIGVTGLFWVFAFLAALWLGGSFGFLLGAWWADAHDLGKLRRERAGAGYPAVALSGNASNT